MNVVIVSSVILLESYPPIELGLTLTCFVHITAVGTKLSKMVTLQEKEKTYITFNVSQWNQTFFQVIFGHLFWSVLHEI